jgi:23S rRNA pseudouridine2605 synthase
MAGRASRREAERLLVAGRIRVNGRVVAELGTRVVPGRDRVELDGDPVVLTDVRWIAFHKPPGVLTTRSDPHGGTTVYDLLPPDMGGLRYVGRLDRPTEGLLLLTNDGEVLNALLHPSREVEREYRATVVGVPGRETLARLRSGVELEDGPAKATRALLAGREGNDGVVVIVMTEGRKREVRRLLEAVGHPLRRLERLRFGPIQLGDLARGAWRPLTEGEVGRLRAIVPP